MIKNYLETITPRHIRRYGGLAGDRLQNLGSEDRETYQIQSKFFLLRLPSLIPEGEFCYLPGVTIFANRKYHGLISDLVESRFCEIENISGQAPKNIIIFAGPGKIMNNEYRSIGSSKPPHEFAILGADTCFLNTDWIEMLGQDNPAVRRAIRHEPAHAAWNFITSDQPQFGYVTDLNTTIHEALGGPLGYKAWGDVFDSTGGVPELDFSPLLNDGNLFWKLISKYQNELGYHQPYFLNPVVGAFYVWAATIGDEKYWYEQALQLRPKVKERYLELHKQRYERNLLKAHQQLIEQGLDF